MAAHWAMLIQRSEFKSRWNLPAKLPSLALTFLDTTNTVEFRHNLDENGDDLITAELRVILSHVPRDRLLNRNIPLAA